jgi:hypothetical protein
MTKTQNIVACAALALASAIAFRSAFWKSDKTPPVLPATLLAQDNPKPTQAANQTIASPTPVAVAQPVKSPPAIAENDARTAADGKEVLPLDGKETLPSIGMFIPSRPFAVDPASGGPGTEFLNKNKSSSNQLLDPPNPENVDGPVVSPETR